MPIAWRELRLQARSSATFWARFITGIVVLICGAAFAVVYSSYGANPASFLSAAVYAVSLMCLFLGAQITSDSISREKREGTLGLLFLAGLPAWQITGGKLIANLLAAMMRIGTALPFFALVMIAGGVMPWEVIGSALFIANTLFVSGSIGIFNSVGSDEQKRAAGRSSFMVMAFWWGLPALAALNQQTAGPRWLTNALALCSLNGGLFPGAPGFRLAASPTPWLNIACTHLIGWLFLIAATVRLRFSWQDRPDGARFSVRTAWRNFWSRLSYGDSTARAALRERLLAINPFLWLAVRNRLRVAGIWIVTVSMLAVGAFSFFAAGSEPALIFSFCVGLAVLHQFMACSMGAAQLMLEQEQGSLEMLLSTPLSTQDVIDGQLKASLRQLRGPVKVVLGLHFVAWLAFGGRALWATVAIFLSAFFYLFNGYTALWLAMWGAATAADARKASGAATARLAGLPVFVCATVALGSAVLNTFFGANIELRSSFVVPGIVLLVTANNLYWLRRTRRELPALLAAYAFRRYSPGEELGFLGRLGRDWGKAFRSRESYSAHA